MQEAGLRRASRVRRWLARCCSCIPALEMNEGNDLECRSLLLRRRQVAGLHEFLPQKIFNRLDIVLCSLFEFLYPARVVIGEGIECGALGIGQRADQASFGESR